MNKKTKLSPVKGRLVPLEDGTPWPSKDGDPIDHEVVMTRYYRRRIRDGDLRDNKAEAGVPADNKNREEKTRKAGK